MSEATGPSRAPRRRRQKVKGRKDDPREVRLSKTLAYALRHGAEELQLTMRPSGYVRLDQLLALPLFQSFSQEEVEEVVATNTKKRFTITADEETGDHLFIRANQGHTLSVVEDEELLEPLTEPDAIADCVHGTYLSKWESIYEHGLSRMTRNHIHLAPSSALGGDVVSGMRSNCNLLLYIDFPSALSDGIRFYRSSNNVVLTPGERGTGVLDRKYIIRAVKLPSNDPVYERE